VGGELDGEVETMRNRSRIYPFISGNIVLFYKVSPIMINEQGANVEIKAIFAVVYSQN
jgi:hypothetical protein